MVLPKISHIFAHLASWLLFFSLVISFNLLSSGEQQSISSYFSRYYIQFYATYIFIFYCNLLFLIPYLYVRGRYILYIAAISLLLLGVYYTQPFDRIFNHNSSHQSGSQSQPQPQFDRPPPGGPQFGRPPFDDHSRPPGPPQAMNPPPPRNDSRQIDIVSIILFFMTWSLSTAMQIIRQLRFTEQRAMQAEADKAHAELSFLKAQINPHFLFNTLNNIYSLAVTNSQQTPEAIMKLSNIMRYMTDEVSNNFVSLENEIDCISNYIDLQRLRLNTGVSINFSVSGDLGNKQIAPLVLMTFIENVFKYGISSHEPSEIIIKLFVDERTIDFFCQNKVFPAKQMEREGIGINNTRQRLEHLYPSRHVLNIISSNDQYTVHLSLQL